MRFVSAHRAEGPEHGERSGRAAGALDWAIEVCVYATIALALLWRARLPEMALWPLTAVLVGAMCVPPLLAPARREAEVFSRAAIVISIGLLLQLRLPVALPGLAFLSPRGEPLQVSLTAVPLVAAAVLAALRWAGRVRPEESRSDLVGAILWVTAGLVLFAVGTWAILNRALERTRGEGLFYAETASTVSIASSLAVVAVAVFLLSGTAGWRRVAGVASLALVVRLLLPATGVG